MSTQLLLNLDCTDKPSFLDSGGRSCTAFKFPCEEVRDGLACVSSISVVFPPAVEVAEQTLHQKHGHDVLRSLVLFEVSESVLEARQKRPPSPSSRNLPN